MEFGVILGDVRASMDPADQLTSLLRQVEAAQRNGVTYLTIAQHFAYGEVRSLQPIPTLARIAGEVDAHVKLATTVLEVPFYHPIALAEELATLDILSAGRLVIGAGAGYRPEEFTAFGLDIADRFAMMEESIGVMKELWHGPSVSHHGRFWNFDDVRPHIRPVQQPHPPIWIGAMKEIGVRRSARLGDGWPIVPETATAEIVRLLTIFETERDRLGLPHVRHPLRREIVPAATADAAYDRFESMAKSRLLEYARLSHPTRKAEDLNDQFRETAAKEAFLGTPEQCIAMLTELAAVVPIDPVIVRAHWLDMSTEAVVAYLDDLGRDIIPAVRELTSVDRVVQDAA